jgi:hypothetical protein
MILNRLSLIILSLIIFTSCNLGEKLNDLATFNINNEVNFTIPSTTVIDLPINIQTPDISSSSEQSFENNNTRANLVENVNLSSLKLTITSPNARTFSFLKSIQIYINNDEQGETLLAEKQDIPTDIDNILELDATKANLDEYIKKSSYSLRYIVTTRETVNSATDVQAAMVFEVKAKLL